MRKEQVRNRQATAGWLLALAIITSIGFAQAESPLANQAVEQVGFGEINWTGGWIHARGVGRSSEQATGEERRAQAERAGYLMAVRNLAEIINGVRVDAEATVDRYLQKNEVVRTRVNGFIRGAQIEHSRELADKSVEVSVKMPLWGPASLVTAFLPEKGASDTMGLERKGEEGYTGLIIDARGLGLKPACFPVILDQHGVPLYGPHTVEREAMENNGMVEYQALPAKKDISYLCGEEMYIIKPVQAAPAPREGKSPLRLKGIGKAGSLQANVLVSQDDAAKLREDAGLARALRRGKVVIVTDPLIGGMEGRAPGPLLAGR